MNKLFLTLSISVTIVSAQSGLVPPQPGYIAASDHSWRPVLGFAGNLLLGSPAAHDVTSAAWSTSFGLVKTSSSVLALDGTKVLGRMDAAPGPALFAFNANGSSAFALLPASGILYTWNGTAFQTLPFSKETPAGQPLAMATPSLNRISLIVQREDGLWLLEMSTRGYLESQSALPNVKGPVLLQNDGSLLYVDQTALVVRPRTGNERRIEVGIPIGEMRWMANGWVHALEPNHGRQYAVRITSGSETVSQLPETRP